MAAQAIELDCPTCETELELDRGFAGGVCRCSTCGTLMLVPNDPAHDRPERLVRPTRPGQPVVAHAGGNGEVGRSRSKVSEATLASDTATATEAGTYVTESGRTVEINRHTRIATAKHRRTGVRITTTIVFSLIVAAMLGAGIWAMVVMMSASDAGEPLPPRSMVTLFPYDREVNPYTLDKPNMVGLPIGERTLIVVDASDASGGWLEDMTEAAAKGLSRVGSTAQVRLIYATAGGSVDATGGYIEVGNWSAADLRKAGGKAKAGGVADLEGVLAEASTGEITHVILITGRKFNADSAGRIASSLGRAAQARVDVVTIDNFPPSLGDLARDRRGEWVKLLPSQLATWRKAAG